MALAVLMTLGACYFSSVNQATSAIGNYSAGDALLLDIRHFTERRSSCCPMAP